MSKILREDEWYDALTSSTLYEIEFERIAFQKSKLLFPGFIPSIFKQTVYSDMDAARPDYALIEQQYRQWWIVELELAHHSFHGHVLPQITTLTQAAYGAAEADALASKNPSLDPARLRDLLKGQLPRILVVVNEAKLEWEGPLQAIGAEMAVFGIFRSDRNRYLYSFDGFSPQPPAAILSLCRLDRTLTWALRVDSPGALGMGRNQRVDILFQDAISEWERIDSADAVWLVPKARIQLQKTLDYAITRVEDGRLQLAPVSKP